MRYLTLAVFVGLFFLSSSATEAAPRWIEDACFFEGCQEVIQRKR
jgi:hypothetical protein